MTPLLGGDASGASHPSTGTPNRFRPNTLRNNNVGTYIRDQWNLTPKITASVGLRWEYYSLPRRADHGIEVYDFDTNRLLICGVACFSVTGVLFQRRLPFRIADKNQTTPCH